MGIVPTDPDSIVWFISFKVGGRSFAVDIKRVKEITRYRDVVQIRRALPFICGVMNLRGVFIPVVDMAKRLGIESHGTGKVIIVSINGRIAGLGVDEVKDIESVETKWLKKKIRDEFKPWKGYIDRIIDTGTVTIPLINPSKLLTDEEIRLLDSPIEDFRFDPETDGTP